MHRDTITQSYSSKFGTDSEICCIWKFKLNGSIIIMTIIIRDIGRYYHAKICIIKLTYLK